MTCEDLAAKRRAGLSWAELARVSGLSLHCPRQGHSGVLTPLPATCASMVWQGGRVSEGSSIVEA
jgi:hypothetical protein